MQKNCIFYDQKDSIGKRYARMDEIGTPYCFTIDFQTKDDNTLTIRDRDTSKQDRIHLSDVAKELSGRLGSTKKDIYNI